MAYRIAAGLRKIARAVVVLTERIANRPLSETTMKKLAVSATRRSTFVWTVNRGIDRITLPEHSLFVRVEQDVIEEAMAESFSTMTEETRLAASPTSSGAMMFEFSSTHFDLDTLDIDDASTETAEEYVETAEEIEYFESLYEDLTVDAVLEYMDTIELYAAPKTATQVLALAQPATAALIEAPAAQIIGLLSAPYVYEESEEEKAFFEDLYDDLAVDAVLGYMDTIELYAKPFEVPYEYVETDEETAFFDSLFEELGVDAIIEYMDSVDRENENAFFEDLYEDLAVDAVMEYMDNMENEFFEDLYEDLTVDAVLEYMDTIETEARPAPEYVISEIQTPEVCETPIAIEAPVEAVEEAPVQKVAVQSILTQFVFGFDTPAKAQAGGTKFRFIAGEEDEPEEDVENVQVMTYSGSAAVSAQSYSNGSLAL